MTSHTDPNDSFRTSTPSQHPDDHPHRKPLVLNAQPLAIDEVIAVARFGKPVVLGEKARQLVEQSRRVVDEAIEKGDPVYGLNTGFGSLSLTRIEHDDVRTLQRNLIRSHAAGIGEPLSRETVRAMIVILTASLSRGRSGVRPVVIERLIDLLHHDVIPLVPSRGSVGASGDLAPLAHVALVLMGEGQVLDDRTGAGPDEFPADRALARAGLEPITLEAKEGLALINGTHLMSAMGTLALHDLDNIMNVAVLGTAMMIDACMATDAFLDERLHVARHQHGQTRVASMMRELLAGSTIVTSHKTDDPRVQDPYSLRCSPQVLGAAMDTIEHVRGVFGRELGGVTDNPLIFAEGEPQTVSGGNFHGMPLAIAMDSLKIAVAHLAGIAERRVYFLLAASDSENPINVYLSPQPGLHSGLMIAQYTAAACCNEIQTLATPASVANIPTSAGQEDYNSFGPTGAHQLSRAIDLTRHVLAVELLCAVEAMEYHRPLRSGDRIEKAIDAVRSVVPRLTEDRPPGEDIRLIVDLIQTGAFEV